MKMQEEAIVELAKRYVEAIERGVRKDEVDSLRRLREAVVAYRQGRKVFA